MMTRIIPLVVIITILIPIAIAGETTYGHVQVARVRSVYDGDTIRVDIAGWPALIGENILVRVAGVDTPEINGKCEYERRLAIQARDAVIDMLSNGGPVILGNTRRGKYFRIIAEVWGGISSPLYESLKNLDSQAKLFIR